MLVGTEAQSGAQRIVAEVTQPDVLAHLTYWCAEAHEAEGRKERHPMSWPWSPFVSLVVFPIRVPYAVNEYEAFELH
jgi:hypothetical protein